MRAVTIRTRAVLAAVLAAATVGGVAADAALAHKTTTETRIRWVASTAPDTNGQYELHLSSRVRACYQRVHVQVVRDGRILYAARTNANGVAPSLHTGGPRLFGPEFAGSRAIVRTRTIRRSGGHTHRCGGRSRAFPVTSG